MKFLNQIKFLALTVAILLASSCTKDFENINTNPNEPVAVPANYLLSGAQKQLMDTSWDEWFNGRFGMLYSQYWSQNAYTDESRYQPRPNITDSYWTLYYSGSNANGGGLADLQEIIKINTENNIGAVSENQIAIARIMKAWTFQNVTDIWGDIPYSEALQGESIRSPKFDKQSDVYAGLVSELTAAIAQLDASAASFASGDVIYNGDVGQWKKFASSLLMRVSMRMSDVSPAAAKTAFESAYSGAFETNGDNAMFYYGGAAPDNNPLNEDHKTRSDFAVSQTLLDMMNSLNDPRRPFYAEEAAVGGGYVGLEYGGDGLADPTTVSQPSGAASNASGIYAPDAPGMYMTYAEVCFLMAEAVERGWSVGGGTAADWWARGIEASFDQWGVANAVTEAAAYVSANPYDGTQWKKSIGVQKWLAMYMQGLQGWFEYRRLDFGVLVLPVEGALQGDGSIPVRRPYPNRESDLNQTNYQAAVSSQGLDAFQLNQKVWWDVN